MTTICRDYSSTRTMPNLGAGEAPPLTPEEAEGLLIREERELKLIQRTAIETCDVHTAVTRALRSHLELRTLEHEGREIRFQRVVEDWADVYEEGGVYPVAAVWSEDEGTYGGNVGSGGLPTKEVPTGQPEPAVTYLQERGEFMATVVVRAYCNDKEERVGVRRMLDKAFAPVHWSGGFFLRMPFHHNAIASYTLRTGQMQEDVDVAGPGLRSVQMKLLARAPWLAMFQSTRYRPHVQPAQIVPPGSITR